MAASRSTPHGAAGDPSEDEGRTKRPGWTLTACILASSLAFLDGSVVNVALPSIGLDLRARTADLQWAINAYLLPLSALLLIGGAAGDHFGRRRLMIGGIALFAPASLGCALSPSLAVLLPMRAVQGIGAAMLMPNSLAILGGAFSGEAKGRAIGSWAAAGAIASAIGLPLGGWLAQTIGWRAIFFINVPVAAMAILVAWAFVEESADRRQPLDMPGATAATLALAGLTWALTDWSSMHLMPTSGWIALAGGSGALGAFIAIERRRGDQAMMPLALFGSRPFVGLTLLTFLLYGALGGLLVLLPYVLIRGAGYTALQAGAVLLPFPVIIGMGSRLMGQLATRLGPRLPLSIGPAVAALGLLLLTRIDQEATDWRDVLPAMIVIALGMASAVAPLTAAVLSSVDGRHTGTASGFNSAVARTGGLIATALSGVVIGRQGDALFAAFHGAAIVGAGAAFTGAVAALATLGGLTADE